MFRDTMVDPDAMIDKEEEPFFDKMCRALGLDPATTTPHKLECRALDLDPEQTSPDELAAARLGLPVGTPPGELDRDPNRSLVGGTGASCMPFLHELMAQATRDWQRDHAEIGDPSLFTTFCGEAGLDADEVTLSDIAHLLGLEVESIYELLNTIDLELRTKDISISMDPEAQIIEVYLSGPVAAEIPAERKEKIAKLITSMARYAISERSLQTDSRRNAQKHTKRQYALLTGPERGTSRKNS